MTFLLHWVAEAGIGSSQKKEKDKPYFVCWFPERGQAIEALLNSINENERETVKKIINGKGSLGYARAQRLEDDSYFELYPCLCLHPNKTHPGTLDNGVKH